MTTSVELIQESDDNLVLVHPYQEKYIPPIVLPRQQVLEKLEQVVEDLKHVLYGNYTPTRTSITAELTSFLPTVTIASRNNWWVISYSPKFAIKSSDELRFGYAREFVMNELRDTWGRLTHEIELLLNQYVEETLKLS